MIKKREMKLKIEKKERIGMERMGRMERKKGRKEEGKKKKEKRRRKGKKLIYLNFIILWAMKLFLDWWIQLYQCV